MRLSAALLLLRCLACFTLAACSAGVTSPGQPTPTPSFEHGFGASAPRVLTPAPGVTGDPNTGHDLILQKGCAGCHTVAGVPGATGVTGPNLTNMALRPTIAGESIPNSPDMLVQWLLDPPALKPGTTMPKLGLTDAEARDLVAFLEAQPRNSE